MDAQSWNNIYWAIDDVATGHNLFIGSGHRIGHDFIVRAYWCMKKVRRCCCMVLLIFAINIGRCLVIANVHLVYRGLLCWMWCELRTCAYVWNVLWCGLHHGEF